jgi:hypothetical protein
MNNMKLAKEDSRYGELVEFCKEQTRQKCITIGDLKKILSPLPDDYYVYIKGAIKKKGSTKIFHLMVPPLIEQKIGVNAENFTIEYEKMLESHVLLINGIYVEEEDDDSISINLKKS